MTQYHPEICKQTCEIHHYVHTLLLGSIPVKFQPYMYFKVSGGNFKIKKKLGSAFISTLVHITVYENYIIYVAHIAWLIN